MALSTGSRFGPYTIEGPLGAGGMGEVYRASDSRLGRHVAVKILPDLFAADPERLARFDREARLLATLNHPNIAVIHGIEESAGMRALVLELVEGPTLDERISLGPLPQAEALRIAGQIADAIEAAHAQGIVHRDLKPSNIKVRPEGTVKVLDFGLAKALEPVSLTATSVESPTVTSPVATAQGILLGTAAYMSPEQARGQPVDRRADVWAFGCVLYEMLTGRRAFQGKSVTDTIAILLLHEPDWTALPDKTPEAVRRLLRRALEKDPKRRLADIADARLEIEDAQREPSGPAAARPRRNAERLAWLLAAALGLLLVITMIRGTRQTEPGAEIRVDIAAPPTAEPEMLAISPDGRSVVFVARTDGLSHLWLRSTDADATSVRRLRGTDSARLPFWSPDGRSVAFAADAQIKVIDVDSGSVRPLASAPVFLGGTWGVKGDILFAADANSPIFRIPAAGGQPVAVTTRAMGEQSHQLPHFLPDGRHFLYHVRGAPNVTGLYVNDLEGKTPRRLLTGDSTAVYAASGHLIFLRDGTAYSQPFDPVRLEIGGEAVAFAENIARASYAGALLPALSVSAAGPLVYRTGSAAVQQFQFAWFDRSGREIGKVGEPLRAALNPALSPDGRRVAVFSPEGPNANIWMLDTRTASFSRFTLDRGTDFAAVWSGDGSRIAISSNRMGGVYHLFVKPASGAGSEALLLESDQNEFATDWSRDGRFLLYRSLDPGRAFDIHALPMKDGARAGEPFPILQTDADERDAQFSPDGRWIAYQSNQSGRFEIWIRPFVLPGEQSADGWQVSTAGGTHARWNDDGTELFYVAPDGHLMSVPIELSPDKSAIETRAPARLFAAAGMEFTMTGTMLPPYMVSKDGKRFLVATIPARINTAPITLVLNWRGR